jgi:hypothetical protein
MNEINTVIHTEENIRVSIDQFDEGVWLGLQARGASMHTVLTRDEAQQMMAALQLVLDREMA